MIKSSMEPSAASPAAVKFWEAVIARDRDAAIRNAGSLEVPPVEASPFDFDDSPRSGGTIESGVLVGEGTSAAGESIISSASLLMLILLVIQLVRGIWIMM